MTRALELARTRGPLVDLTESNPTRAGFVTEPEQLAGMLATADAVRYEPDPRGWIGARRAVAEYYRRRGTVVDEERVLLTSSTSEAYALLFKLLCDADDEVLVPTPSYPLFEHLAAAECARAVPYRLSFDGRWSLDASALEDAVTPRTRALVVVSPNNPTGSVLTTRELEVVARVCRDRGLVLICDEVFADYPIRLSPDAASSPYALDGVLVFTLNGLSKIAGLPQLKAGWIVAGGDDRRTRDALPRLEFLADLYLSVGTPVQRALPALLERSPAIRRAIQEALGTNLRTLHRAIEGTAIDVLPTEAGWAAVVRVPRILDDETFALQLLDAESTVVQPGYLYDFEDEGFIVVSLLTPPPTFEEGVRRLVSFVGRL